MSAPLSIRSHLVPIGLAALLVFASGCGKGSQVAIAPEDNPTFGPHAGPVAALPGGGVVEVASEAAGAQSRLVVFFYASDAMDRPLSSQTTDVRIDLAMPGGESASVSLAPAAGGGEGARFASDPGEYTYDPLVGTLSATIDGEPVSVPFSGAQS
jgi:hypothetical protein